MSEENAKPLNPTPADPAEPAAGPAPSEPATTVLDTAPAAADQAAEASAAPTTVMPEREDDARQGTHAAGTRVMPAPAPAPRTATEPPAHDAVQAWERRHKAQRNALVALTIVAVLLVVAVGVLAYGVVATQQQLRDLQQAQVEAGADEGEPSRPGIPDKVDPDHLRAADLVQIVGENWANAQKILEAYGVDPDDVALITDDGSEVVNPVNWTVTLVSDLDDEGTVAVHLRRDREDGLFDWMFG